MQTACAITLCLWRKMLIVPTAKAVDIRVANSVGSAKGS